MEQQEIMRVIVEAAVWIALIIASVGLKRGLQAVVEAVEKCDSKDVKREVSLTAKGLTAMIIDIMKSIAERRPK